MVVPALFVVVCVIVVVYVSVMYSVV